MTTLLLALALVASAGVTGNLNVTDGPQADLAEELVHPDGVAEDAEETTTGQGSPDLEDQDHVMATGELNPNHYQAQRAAKVVQHFLNSRHGSPFRLFGLHRVHRGHAEDLEDSRRRYQLELSVQEIISNASQRCSAEVWFPTGPQQSPAQVQASCEELLKSDIRPQEQALFERCRTGPSLLSAQYLPDSHGRIDADMKPFWHLGIAAASWVMLQESTESSLFNMAQVANITQLPTENEQLSFDSHVLLHELVSQEILHWRLQFTWSPQGGVAVQQMEQLPHRHERDRPEDAI